MTPLSGSVLTAAEMRVAETQCGIPPRELMERAGKALAEAVLRFGGGAETLVLCGPGNNGGDGYVTARILSEHGFAVRVAASGPPITDLAHAAANAWAGEIITLADAKPASVLVDALFGTGLSRPLSSEIAMPVHGLAAAANFVIAADMPSGLSTDDGVDLGAVQADLTIAFGAAKPAHLLQPGARVCGHVLLAGIGIAAISDVQMLERPSFAPPSPQDHKYTRGMVVVVGGAMLGAAALASIAALRSGAGYVAGVGLGFHGLPHAIVHTGIDILADDRIGAIIIGPGLGRGAEAKSLLDQVLMSGHPLVIDGDALALIDIAALHREAPTILTPHMGEFDRLFGRHGGGKIDRVRDAARRCGCTVVFKGSDTVIASPDDCVTIAKSASTWLSTAGTGDVLAGITGAMLARGVNAHEAACASVWLHCEAARRAGRGLIADDLPAHLSACL